MKNKEDILGDFEEDASPKSIGDKIGEFVTFLVVEIVQLAILVVIYISILNYFQSK